MIARSLTLIVLGAISLAQSALGADLGTRFTRANVKLVIPPQRPAKLVPAVTIGPLTAQDVLLFPRPSTGTIVEFGAPSPNAASFSPELGTETRVFPEQN